MLPGACSTPGAARITFASISVLQPTCVSESDVRHAQQLLVHHAQRLLGSLRLDDGVGCERAGGHAHGHGAAPLAWLRLGTPGKPSTSRASAYAAQEPDVHSAGSQRWPQAPTAKQRLQEEQLAAESLGSNSLSNKNASSQMLVAAATTAATTLLAAASSSLPGAKQQQQQQPRASTSGAGGPSSSGGSGSVRRNSLRHRRKGEGRDDTADDVVCVEALGGGRRRVYRMRCGVAQDGQHWHGFDMVEDEQTHQGRLKELVRNYLLPQVS